MTKTKDQIKQDSQKHTKPQDKFKALWNGILDQAQDVVNNNTSKEDMLKAIDGLRAQADEAAVDIFGK